MAAHPLTSHGICVDAQWRPLEWDSAFFGLRVARLKAPCLMTGGLAQAVAEMDAEGIDLAYLLLDGDAIDTAPEAEACGFHLVDVRVTLQHDLALGLGGEPPLAAQLEVRAYCANDLPALQHVAGGAFRDTRFYTDKRIPRERADALYITWIEGSCANPDYQVFVADWNGVPAGFITCTVSPSYGGGAIGLFAVAAGYHGRGIGRALLHAAQGWARNLQLQHLSVVTQGSNSRAQRLYQRAGFVTTQLQLWFHKWFT